MSTSRKTTVALRVKVRSISQVHGGGREMWGHQNQSFQFAYTQAKGDCSIIAKVESVGSTHPNAKIGLMMRSRFRVLLGSPGDRKVPLR